MKFTIRAVFKRSVTIEIDNSTICYAPEMYRVFLNGEERMQSNLNVLTLEGLTPDTDYRLTVKTKDAEETQHFHTEVESVLLNVRAFGARGDGQQDDTSYLQAAISACPEHGTVYFPKGIWRSRPLFMKSHMTLWLDEGAVLQGDPDRTHYPQLPGMTKTTDGKDEYNLSSWEGNPETSFASLITGIQVEHLDRDISMAAAPRGTGGRNRRRCEPHGGRIRCSLIIASMYGFSPLRLRIHRAGRFIHTIPIISECTM